ncbi:MAG: ribbon-helix-helix protein, CopG family [Candidatus Omnitrophica bacterium]|nr:ribbon-helix-helix protein, CopG family [Candidatus Omnitrophota bacterium]
MVRTQIYLPKDLHQRLTRLASQRGKPMAQLVRDLIDKGLKEREEGDFSGKEALTKLFAIQATGSPKDLSQQVDHYLYGTPKRKK